jgi:outer membrane protein TolC
MTWRSPGCHARRFGRACAALCVAVAIFASLRLSATADETKAPSSERAAPAPDNSKPEKIPPPRLLPDDDDPVNLSQAPSALPASPEVHPIDLDTALHLAEAENPTIGMARQAIQAALADQLRARAMMLPHLRAGLNYHLHNGVLQTSFGEMRRVNDSSFYLGGGARALAAETVAYPAVQIYSHLGDAIFEPLAARRLVSENRARSAAVANDMLLQVALRYLELVRAEAQRSALIASEVDMYEVVRITAAYARVQQGRPADAARAQSEALLLHADRQLREEEIGVASSELGRLLNLDPSVRLTSPVGAIGVVQLVDPQVPLKALIQRGLASRPELAAQRAEIERQSIRVRQERTRPLFPTISVGYSAGTFGGQTNRTDLVPVEPGFGARTDFDVIAYWTLQNAGVGNAALVKQRRAQRGEAVFEQTRLMNLVGREVAEAHALSDGHYQKLLIAERRLKTAVRGFQEDLTRIKGAAGIPIEVLNSLRLLTRARLVLVEETFAYDVAQFRLFVALGQAPPTTTDMGAQDGAARVGAP